MSGHYPMVALSAIAQFAGDGQIYRAYAHALAACRGMVLLVPIELVNGDLTELVDACPIPWEEVIRLIEEPDRAPRPLEERITDVLGRPLRALAPTNWDVDEIPIGIGFDQSKVIRLSHPSGIRIGVLADLVPHGWH